MATTTVQAATKGQRKAMTLLYEANKRKVCYAAECILLDKEQAVHATAWVFKNIWDSSELSSMTTEEEFTYLAIGKLVEYCKTRILAHNPKAFKVPKNRNFQFVGERTISDEKNAVLETLTQLPELHRFIFVLQTIGVCDFQQIAKLLKCDHKSIESALDAEKGNIESMICPQKGNQITYDLIMKMMFEGEMVYTVLQNVDEQVMEAIDAIATPIEKKRKKTVGMVTGIVVGACVCIAIIVAIIWGIGNNTSNSGGTGNSGGNNNGNASGNAGGTSGDTSEDKTYTPEALDVNLTYYADIEIEEYGTITVQLDQKSAPITAANFVELAKSGFYDGLTFHNVKEGSLMQGGDPSGNGTGGSDNSIVGEFSENGYENNLSHTRGAISMARFSDYDSATSQFFIVHEDRTDWDGEYAVFGYVTEGLEVVDAVCEGKTGSLLKEEQPVMKTITIRTE